MPSAFPATRVPCDRRPSSSLSLTARLRREISYYCGVIARTESRDRIRGAHARIRERERRLRETLSMMADGNERATPGGRDE